MVDETIQSVTRRLRELKRSVPGIKGTAIITSDGTCLTSVLDEDVDEELLSVASSIMIESTNTIIERFERGRFEETIIRGNNGNLLVGKCSESVLIAMFLSSQMRLGPAVLELRRARNDIASLI